MGQASLVWEIPLKNHPFSIHVAMFGPMTPLLALTELRGIYKNSSRLLEVCPSPTNCSDHFYESELGNILSSIHF